MIRGKSANSTRDVIHMVITLWGTVYRYILWMTLSVLTKLLGPLCFFPARASALCITNLFLKQILNARCLGWSSEYP